MFRKSAVSAALLLITAASNLHALGLGNIDMQSALNQPMDAVIELTSPASTDLSKVHVTLASQADHKRVGLSRSSILNDFDFTVEKDSRGRAVIKVTSHNAVHEPFLEFLLELSWPNGHLLREYTVLVDPPITMPATPARPVAPRSSAVASSPVSQPQRTVRPATTTAHSSPLSTPYPADSYGPIRRNETLWSIAERLRSGTGATTHQMMLALQRKNPQAFDNHNINNLRAGTTLSVPSQNELRSMSAAEAFAETSRQYDEWKAGTRKAAAEKEVTTETAAASKTGGAAAGTSTPEARLQLMAPDLDAVDQTAAPGDPSESTADSDAANTEQLDQQLAMATEEAATSKAQASELQSQVSELEQQVETMKRLLELKDEELASMQQNLAADSTTEDAQLATAALDEPATDETAPASESTDETAAGATDNPDEAPDEERGIVNKLIDNPLLAGLGVLVALLLGGFLWSSTRRKGQSSLFDDEATFDKQVAESSSTASAAETAQIIDIDDLSGEKQDMPDPGSGENDPLTEADVYLAYGRIQQAEDVLQAALDASPDDSAIRLKLLQVYHAAGNVTAFDREASDFRDGVTEEDAAWMQVATMGHAMSPDNDLYRAAATPGDDAAPELDMGLSPVETQPDPVQMAEEDTTSDIHEIEFNLDEPADTLVAVSGDDDEDVSEGLLNSSDEVATKLDLARAYLDMGDPDGARSILGEVMEEGNDEQKNEAESLISKLA